MPKNYSRYCFICGRALRSHQRMFCSTACLTTHQMTPQLARRMMNYYAAAVERFVQDGSKL